jgi:SM-20-related protein
MEESFEALINSYIETNVGIGNNFLPDALAANLTANLLKLYNQNQMSYAGTGSSGNVAYNKNNRGDSIYWLDRNHNNKDENDFFDHMDTFVDYLNSQCYTGIKSYEFHYALYQPDTFYKRHLDQFQNSANRVFSIISYLNPDWKESDGGELYIYHKTTEQRISPTNGKTVFFKSNELEHEVLTTQVNRLSITGWLKT